jgi:hypothetical protein
MKYNPGAAMLPIPSLLATALATIGAVVLSRLVAREWQRVNAELETLRAATVRTDARKDLKDLPTLRRDPVTGEYRPQWP